MKTGIIGAVRQEVDLLFAALAVSGSPVRVGRQGDLEFHEGELDGCPVVIVCAGVGKVNAALCAQILITAYGVDCVINTGSAGGLRPDLRVLDMVVSTDCVQHDVDVTGFGYRPGHIPGMSSPFFEADARLRQIALVAFARAVSGFPSAESGEAGGVGGTAAAGDNPPPKMAEGRIASGDVFVCDAAVRQRIIDRFDPACVEMEGAAVAQVCVINRVRFVILRSVSDLAGAEASMSYEDFSKIASQASALVVREMLAELRGIVA
jgi:adenosylhomocysteine nucleosidase